jgi:anti-anti-sigma factor
MQRTERPTVKLQIEQRDDGVVHVRIEGELDVSTAPELISCLKGLLTDEVSGFVFDLSELQFVDSSGLGVLVMATKRVRAEGKKLVLVSPRSQVARLLDITGLNEYFDVKRPDR